MAGGRYAARADTWSCVGVNGHCNHTWWTIVALWELLNWELCGSIGSEPNWEKLVYSISTLDLPYVPYIYLYVLYMLRTLYSYGLISVVIPYNSLSVSMCLLGHQQLGFNGCGQGHGYNYVVSASWALLNPIFVGCRVSAILCWSRANITFEQWEW